MTARFISTCSICPGSARDRAEVRRGSQSELDVLADDATQHLANPGDQLVQINDLELEDLLAAEGEKLLRQGRSTLGSLHDLRELGPERLGSSGAV